MLAIVRYPHPALTQKTRPVDVFDESLHILSQQMLETMYGSHGIGLAANQVANMNRLFVMKCNPEAEPFIFINPEIIQYGSDKIDFQEGCLSFPGLQQDTQRFNVLQLRWQDLQGLFHEQEFTGLEAICIQHEIDHLNGISFIDHLSQLKKQLVLKKYQKTQKK